MLKVNSSSKSLVERVCDFKIYAISVHPTRQPSRPRTIPFSVQLQDRTTLYLLTFLELAPYVVLVLTWWVFTPSALRLAIQLQHARPRSAKALRKSKRLVATIVLLFSLYLPSGRKNFLLPPWPVAPRMLSMLFIVSTVMANLMKFRRIKSRRLLLDFLTNYMKKTRVADILPHMKLVSRASRPGLTVGILRILYNGLCTALRCHTEEHDNTCRVGCQK